jgi:hypothetical protein
MSKKIISLSIFYIVIMLNTKIVQASSWSVTTAQQPQSLSFQQHAAPAQAHPQPAQAALAQTVDDLRQALARQNSKNRSLKHGLDQLDRFAANLKKDNEEKDQIIETNITMLSQTQTALIYAQTLADLRAGTMAEEHAKNEELRELLKHVQAQIKAKDEEMRQLSAELSLEFQISREDRDKKDEDIRVLNIQLRQEQDLRKRSDAALAVQQALVQKLEEELAQQREQAHRQ